jgi:hypothetical protein
MKHYQIKESAQTEEFYKDIAEEAETINCPVAQAVARVVYQKSGTGGYFWRSICGGTFYPEKVIIQGPNCIDYAIVLQNILKKYFNINSQIKETQLVLVKKHQYLLTDNNEVLDLIVGISEFPDGYFKNEKIYLKELEKINQQKWKLIPKQIKAILFPKTRKKLC